MTWSVCDASGLCSGWFPVASEWRSRQLLHRLHRPLDVRAALPSCRGRQWVCSRWLSFQFKHTTSLNMTLDMFSTNKQWMHLPTRIVCASKPDMYLSSELSYFTTKNTSMSHTVASLPWTHTVVYFYSHTPSCSHKYTMQHQMWINRCGK